MVIRPKRDDITTLPPGWVLSTGVTHDLNRKIVHDFLEDYGEALSAGDLPDIVNCWDIPALVFSDQGARMVSEAAEVEQFFAGAVERYQAQGIVATRPGTVEVKKLSERLVSVDAHWSVIDISGIERPSEYYLLSIADDGQPRIRMAMALANE